MSKPVIPVVALLCEKALIERDFVPTAVRLVDVFHVPKGVTLEGQHVVIPTILVITKFAADDFSPHTLALELVRPSGEKTKMDERAMPLEHERYPDLPSGFTISFTAPILAKELGTHYIIVYLDGEEATRILFSLVQQKLEEAQ